MGKRKDGPPMNSGPIKGLYAHSKNAKEVFNEKLAFQNLARLLSVRRDFIDQAALWTKNGWSSRAILATLQDIVEHGRARYADHGSKKRKNTKR